MKRYIGIFLKAGISVGLLAFFFFRIDFSEFLRTLSAARLPYVAAALLIYLVGQVLSSVRWTSLARAVGFRNPLTDFVAYFFIGMFFNLFAPSTVGGDVGKVFYLARDGVAADDEVRAGAPAYATVSVLADRAIGMLVLIWIGAIALAVFPEYRVPDSIRYVTFALGGALLLGCLSLSLISRIMPGKEHPIGKKLHLALQNYPRHWRSLVRAVLLSVVVHTLQSWMHVLLGHALEIDIPWSYAFIIYPLVGTFSALPISFGGIGLREGGYIFMLQQINVGQEKAIAFGLLWFVIVALDSLIGGLIFVLKKGPAPVAAASEAKNYVRK